MKVFKYSVPVAGINSVPMPQGAKILRDGEQGGKMFVWALVDETRAHENRQLFVCGTGWEMPVGPFDYLGTVFVGPFVWHIWEAK